MSLEVVETEAVSCVLEKLVNRISLGYGTVSKASPDTMFVALEDFRRKVILFEPPDCKARDEARVLQCWTKGRI